jgi:alpha-N-acetylglucosamine transferase
MSSKRLRVVLIAVLTTLLFFYLQSQTGERTSSWLSHAEKDVDWSRFAYTQYVTNSEYLCNSLMFFESLKRHGSRPDRVMMVPESMLEPEMVNSSDAYLLNKARDEYNVKLVPITIQTNWAGDGKLTSRE